MQRATLWHSACTGGVGGLTLGLLSTQNPTLIGLGTAASMGAVGAALLCWHWWADVRPLHLYIRRQIHGQCPHCGYDLTGNVSGVCPECGESMS